MEDSPLRGRPGALLAVCLAAALFPRPSHGGACCYPNGMCVQEAPVECRTFHGVYQGDGTLCAETVCACSADLSGDGQINASDLVFVLLFWGPCPGCPADIDQDGEVAITDLNLLISTWGGCS